MTSDNGSYVGRLGTKIGQSLKNLDNLNKEMTTGMIDGAESDLRAVGEKSNPSKINYESKIIDN